MSSATDAVIGDNSVVVLHYTLKNATGDVLESSSDGDPMAYLHGHKNIIPGLESELSGKTVGDKLTANVAAADAYGVHEAGLIQDVPKDQFPSEPVPQVGMQFQAQSEAGVRVVTVTAVTDDAVTIDGNHPLAGQDLTFDVEIVEVRVASEEELAHGHVHGPGGHEH